MESKPKDRPAGNLRLMDQVRQVLRYHHYSYRMEQSYCDWILRYVKFHGGKTHPNKMGKYELMGHGNVKTTEVYTHVMEKNIDAVVSPLDALKGESRSGSKEKR